MACLGRKLSHHRLFNFYHKLKSLLGYQVITLLETFFFPPYNTRGGRVVVCLLVVLGLAAL